MEDGKKMHFSKNIVPEEKGKKMSIALCRPIAKQRPVDYNITKAKLDFFFCQQ